MGYRTLRLLRGIYVNSRGQTGFWSKYGPQTDSKQAPTECYSCSARAWPYEEWRAEMISGNINSRDQIGFWSKYGPPNGIQNWLPLSVTRADRGCVPKP